MSTELKKENRSTAFVHYVINCIKNNKAKAAALSRADNPSTEYQSWEHLASFGVNLELQNQRLPYGLIAAALAKAKITQNGSINIGEAIARCYPDGNKSDQAKAKLRRLIACNSIEEVCNVLRPLLRLIESRCNKTLNYAGLLNDLLFFDYDCQKTKSQWAQNFYKTYEDKGVNNDS